MNSEQPFDPAMIVNPFYVVSLADYLFMASRPKTAKEDWVLLNASLMNDMGATAWLEEFLDAISQSHVKYDGHDIINPTLTISLSEHLKGTHEALVARDEWVAANAKLATDIGAARWLELLLTVLTE